MDYGFIGYSIILLLWNKEMIKYHGTPITPKEVFFKSMNDKNVLIPYTCLQDLNKAFEVCNKIIIDNGAFTIWRKGINIEWNDYYDWIDSIYDKITNFFIPDVIDGTEKENDKLISNYLLRYENDHKGIPVWHIDESLHRLSMLTDMFNYIAIGSAGEYRKLGTEKWHNRMDDAMTILCDKNGVPKVKIHMLRCLNSDIFLKYPFYSGDSTNLAQNHSRYNSEKGSNDGWKILLHKIEKYNSPKKYKFKNKIKQKSIFTKES